MLPARVCADSVVVFSEIMYHPEQNEAQGEWIELYNTMAVDVDMSGWAITGGVDYVFDEGTVMRGGGYLLVAVDPAALAAELGVEGILGPFSGRLDNGGERIRLVNNSNREMDEVRYRDRGRWPTGPDGSGVSLAKRHPHAPSGEAASWRVSSELGGTPGVRNFPVDGGSTPLPNGLVSYWSFDGSGASVRDAVGGNNGRHGDGAARVEGIVGDGAFSFDNTLNAFIDVGSGVDDAFSVRDGITIEALVRPMWSGELDDADHIFRKQDGSQRIVLAFQHQDDGETQDIPLDPPVQPVLSFGINVGGMYTELELPLDGIEGRPTIDSLNSGETHHIAATYDAASGVKAIYIDGVRAISVQLEAGAEVSSGGVATAYIGNMAGRRHPFSGTMDEVAFWRRGLSEEEVSTHAGNARNGRSYFDDADDGGVPGDASTTLVFNEARVDAESQWVEIANLSSRTVPLEGLVLATSAGAGAEHVFENTEVAAGGHVVLTSDLLGFPLTAGDKLFLYAKDRDRLIASALLEEGLRGRVPDGVGDWWTPDEETPGAANQLAFRDEIVISEIHYHPAPVLATSGEFDEREILPLDAEWSYDASGEDLGTEWREANFDDVTWNVGRGLFFNERGTLPGPKNTEIELGFTTYYFRTTLELPELDPDQQLAMRLVVDDGAVVYINGTEFVRQNMPEGDIDASTRARRSVGNGRLSENYPLPRDLLLAGPNLIAVEVHQSSPTSNDVAFGAEVFEILTLKEPTSYAENDAGWVELHNRSGDAVDISRWEFDNGIRFTFAEGTTIAAGGFLVVAKEPAVTQAEAPDAGVVGPYDGRLSHRSDRLRLVDANGNLADEVRYQDRAPWPALADGDGASIELRDVRSDNANPGAWGRSVANEASEWIEYVYEGPPEVFLGPSQWHEFVFGLFDAGEVHIDDMSVIADPDGEPVELLQNGDFEQGDASWRLLGTHGQSAVIEDPDQPGNSILRLIATGPTEHMHNHVETTFADGARIATGRVYRVSFRARWIAGSRQLHTRFYFNRMPRTIVLEAPTLVGTPGGINSVNEDNIGPTLTGLSHSPAVPASGEEVVVEAHAEDPDGVRTARVWWSTGGDWQSAEMQRSGDMWQGLIPGHDDGAVVQFYVEAEDELGAQAWLPADARTAGALLAVEDAAGNGGRTHTLRILISRDVDRELHEVTNLMSNHRVPATVVYNGSEVFYDVGVRLRGSERGRPDNGRTGFNIAFKPGKLFRGVQRTVALDRSGGWAGFFPFGSQDEILVKHVVTKAGDIPGMYDDLVRLTAPRRIHSGSALLLMTRFGGDFLDTQYEDGRDGTAYTYELIYSPTTTTGGTEGLKRPLPDSVMGTDHTDLGDNKEAYRWFYLIENNIRRDDYESIMRMAKALRLSGEALDAAAAEALDIDQWLRAFAMYSLCGIGDTYMSGNFHNNMYYVRPSDGKVLIFPWDMDFAFVNGTSAPPWGNHNFRKVIEIPHHTRVYYRHLRDIIDRAFNREYIDTWVRHYGEVAGQNYSGVTGYVDQRSRFILGRIPRQFDLEIRTNDGEPLTVDETSVTIGGVGWIDIATLALADSEEPLEARWPAVTRWEVDVPLRPGENELAFLAFDETGEFVGTDSITVTSTVEGNVFTRGDVNLDGALNVTDGIAILRHLFAGVPAPCEDAADIDDSESVEITDAVRFLSYLFQGGDAPAAPFPQPGLDPDGAELGCASGVE